MSNQQQPPTKPNERTPYQQWKEHRQQNATIGAIFYQANAAEIERTRPEEDNE